MMRTRTRACPTRNRERPRAKRRRASVAKPLCAISVGCWMLSRNSKTYWRAPRRRQQVTVPCSSPVTPGRERRISFATPPSGPSMPVNPLLCCWAGSFLGRRIWSEIADRMGLEQVGSEVLIGAMQSAGEASNAPFLLLVDALNEAENPKVWQNELPALLAEVARNPWISIGLSVRSTYRPIVLPAEGLSGIGETEHRGFAGREVEATERFFNAFDVDQPGVPMLEPEFRNPLFLKLYCEGLRELGRRAYPTGEAHVSAVFDRYLESKSRRISTRLEIDPSSRPVHRAIDAFCGALADANRDSLPYGRAEQIIREFAPGRDRWPDTLLGQLLSEGVLTRDATWQPDIADSAGSRPFHIPTTCRLQDRLCPAHSLCWGPRAAW